MLLHFPSPVLEYRLQKGRDEYIPIFHYPHIELEQILARRECEFFIKEGVTYKQLSSSIEDNVFVIYLEKYEEKPMELEILSPEAIVLEVRQLNNLKEHPLITTIHLKHHIDVLSIIGSIYTYYHGSEWERDSAEIDEDRKVYVLYVNPTGYSFPTQER